MESIQNLSGMIQSPYKYVVSDQEIREATMIEKVQNLALKALSFLTFYLYDKSESDAEALGGYFQTLETEVKTASNEQLCSMHSSITTAIKAEKKFKTFFTGGPRNSVIDSLEHLNGQIEDKLGLRKSDKTLLEGIRNSRSSSRNSGESLAELVSIKGLIKAGTEYDWAQETSVVGVLQTYRCLRELDEKFSQQPFETGTIRGEIGVVKSKIEEALKTQLSPERASKLLQALSIQVPSLSQNILRTLQKKVSLEEVKKGPLNVATLVDQVDLFIELQASGDFVFLDLDDGQQQLVDLLIEMRQKEMSSSQASQQPGWGAWIGSFFWKN